MSSNLVGLLNRIHAVNTEIADVANSDLTLSPRRYYPSLKGIEFMPIIVPLVPGGQHDNETYGSDTLHNTWSIPLHLFVDNFLAGSSPADAQANCEACIQHLIYEYWRRPRLELLEDVTTEYSTESAGAFAYIMEDARLRTNSIINPIDGKIAFVEFTFVVETTDDLDRIGQE